MKKILLCEDDPDIQKPLIAGNKIILSVFLIFGMDNAIFVSYYEYPKQRKEVISSTFWFSAFGFSA